MLTDNQCGKAAVGSAMLKQEGLGCLRKLMELEHEPGSDQPSVTYPVVPAWVSALTSLSDEL